MYLRLPCGAAIKYDKLTVRYEATVHVAINEWPWLRNTA